MSGTPAHSLQGTGLLNGRSEELLGKFTSEYPGSRSSQASICIATKLAPYPWRVTAKQFVAACRWALLCRARSSCVACWLLAGSRPWQDSHGQAGCRRAQLPPASRLQWSLGQYPGDTVNPSCCSLHICCL